MSTTTLDLTSPPAWLDPSTAARITCGAVSVDFSGPERLVLRRRKKTPASRWAKRRRVVTYGVFAGRKWQGALTSYLDGVMDMMVHPAVRELYLVKGVQTGGTEAALNVLGWHIDYAPMPAGVYLPDEALAREAAASRIIPMLEQSPALSRYLTGRQDDIARQKIKLLHMPVYIGWASSAAQLQSKPMGLIIADEVDLYAWAASARHADPISEMRDRLTTYRRFGLDKLVALSTPTTVEGPICAGFAAAEAQFDFFSTCPACGESAAMDFKNITWPRVHPETGAYVARSAVPEGEKYAHPSPDRIRSDRAARYVCPACGDRWDDRRRDEACRAGEWRERTSGLDWRAHLRRYASRTVGVHLPSWISYFFSLSDGAALFVDYLRTRDKRLLRRFQNKIEAKPFRDDFVPGAVSEILELRDERPSGLVPGDGTIAALTAGVDTQDAGFWYWIIGWGYGQSREAWSIRAGYVDTFAAVQQVLWDDAYPDASGRQYPVIFTLQDAMGHRTSEVYDFCRANPGRIAPSMGQRRMAETVRVKKIDHYPGSVRIIPGGLRLYHINTGFFKDMLAAKLKISPADPGAVHLHAEFPETWGRHLAAEEIDPKTGDWINPHNRANHLWDCLVLAAAAAEVIGVRHRAAPGDNQKPPEARPGPALYSPPGTGPQPDLRTRRPRWMDRIGRR